MCVIIASLNMLLMVFRQVPNSAKFLQKHRASAEMGKFCGSAQNSATAKLWSLVINVLLLLEEIDIFLNLS